MNHIKSFKMFQLILNSDVNQAFKTNTTVLIFVKLPDTTILSPNSPFVFILNFSPTTIICPPDFFLTFVIVVFLSNH